MALIKQNIPIAFNQGINTKADDKQLLPGILTKLENAVFTTISQINKRFGLTSLSLDKLDNTKITKTKAISIFQDELNLYDETRFYSHSESFDKWIDRGRLFNIQPKSDPILRNAYQQTGLAVECSEDVHIYAWEDTRGGIRISTTDQDNNTNFLSDFEISSTGVGPRIVSLFNSFYVFYIDGTDIKYRRMKLFDPTTLDAEITIASDTDGTDDVYDVLPGDDRIFVCYNSSAASNNFKIFTIDQDGVSSSVVSLNEDPSNSINLSTDPNNRIVITYANATDLRVTIYSFNLGTQILTPTVIETIAGLTNISTIYNSADDLFTILYEINTSPTTNNKVRKNTLTVAGSVGTPADFMRSVGLASNSFVQDSLIHTILVHGSTLQSTYFLVDLNGCILAKISSGFGGGVLAKNRINNVCRIDSDNVLFTSQIKGRSISEDNTFFSLLGVNSTLIDFDPDVKFQDSVLGDNLHISGGVLQMYDGVEIVEHGFHVFPEGLTAGTNSATGGSMSDGTFLYAAVYAWTDNKGQLHRSASSIGLQVSTTAGGSSQTQDIVVPTLRLTEKSNVVIELYRTADAGIILHKVTEVSSPEFNDKTVDSITITDDKSDLQVLAGELIYSTGGILENIAPPSSSLIISFNERIMLAGLEDENLIQFSKIRQEGGPVEFSDFLTIGINPTGGGIKAHGVLDDKYIIFKESSIFFISGDGPNNVGTQNTFTEPQEIASDVGCIEPESVVVTPLGLMFKSRKGIYILTRSLQTIYIGDRVEEFNNLTITSAVLVPNTNQVRFTTSDGDCLVYDYLMNQWSTFTNYQALDADVFKNQYILLSTFGPVKNEVDDQYNDDGLPINLKIETGWLSFAGLQGFQRVYQFNALGDYHSKHKIKFSFAYDFKEAFIQSVLIDPLDFIDPEAYGEDSPYGEPITKEYGGNGNQYQMKIKMKKQKCQSLKIAIEEIQDSTPGQGLSLSALTFNIGAKVGLFKNDQKQEFGSKSGT